MTAPDYVPGDEAVEVARAGATTDRYGAPRRDWTTATTTTIRGCAVQPISADEAGGGREYAATHMRLYAPAADIRADDRVTWRGQTFEVDGAPAVWYDSGRVHHVEAELKRMAG